MTDKLATILRNHLDTLAADLESRLGAIPDYKRFPKDFRLEVARQDVELVAVCLEKGDIAPLIQDVEKKANQRIQQGFVVEALRLALEALQDVIRPFVEDGEDARFLWQAFSKTNAVLLKVQEEASRKSSEALQVILDAVPAMIWYKDTHNNMLNINRGAAKVEGVEPEQLQGKSCYELYPPEQAEAFYQDDLEVIRSKTPKLGIQEAHTAPGSKDVFWLETSKVPVFDAQGEVVGVIAFAIDITERKRLEEQQRLQFGIIESSPDYIGMATPDGRGLYLNPAGLAMTGCTAEEFYAGMGIASFQPDLPQQVMETVLTEGLWSGEADLVHKDGSRIPVSQVITAVKDEQGNLQAFTTIARDIRGRKRAEAALRENEERLNLALEAANAGVWEFWPQDNRAFFNARWFTMLGYEPDELEHSYATWRGLLHPEDLEVTEALVFDCVSKGKDFAADFRMKAKDGGWRWIHAIGKTVEWTAEGATQRMIGTHTDITEAQEAERTLRESEERFRRMAASLNEGLTIIEGTQVVFVNDRLSEIFGRSKEDLMKISSLELAAPEEKERLQQIMVEARQGGKPLQELEYWIVRPDGARRYVRNYYSMTYQEGRIVGRLVVTNDITEAKLLEQQVQQSLQRRGYQVQVSTQVAQEIAAATGLGELFIRVVTLVKEQFGYYHTQLLRYEPALDAVLLISGYGEIGRKMLEMGHQLPLGVGLIGTAAATGETVLRPDLAGDPDWSPNPLLPETKGEIAVPVKLREQVLGVLDVQSDRAGALGEEDRLLLEGLCGQIAVAIEDTRLRQEMQARLEELNALYRATSRQGWQEFRRTTALPDGYSFDRLEVQPFEGDASDTQTGESLVVNLDVRGETIGALGVLADPKNPLAEHEIELVQQVSEQLAQALESARLFEQTQQSLSETETLYAIGSQINQANTLDDILRIFVGSTTLGGMDQVIFEFFDIPWGEQPPDVMVNAAVWDRSGEIKEPVGTVYRLDEFPFLHYLHRTEPLVVSDVLSDERVDEYTRNFITQELGIRSLVFWPLVAGGQWYGALAGQSGKVLSLSQDEIRMLNSLIEQAANVIQSQRLRQATEERLQELTSLQRMMSREAWVTYQSQLSDEGRGYLFNLANLQPVTTDMLPVLLESDGSTITPTLQQPAYIQTLAVRGEPIGLLGVKQDERIVLSSEDEAFLRAISEQIAQAMERARLMEQTQKSASELEAVAEVSTATATILNPQELLQAVVDLAKSNFGLYHAQIYLLDENEVNLVLTVGSGEIGKSMVQEGWVIPLDEVESVVARSAYSRKGLAVSDVRKESGYLPNPMLPNTLSELAVPLVVGENLLGIFDVQSDRANRFADTDIRTFTTLASQVAVALQNARLYAEQLATVERLRELDDMKSAFLANMSHELRTPLNSILGFTQVLVEGLDGPLTDMMVSDLELIEKNGRHLLNLINDVLDMAKIEAGRLSLSVEPINLYDLLEDVLVSNAPLARDRSLYMDLQADVSQDWIVMGDHVRLRQICINLIGNSIKFTDQGGITLELERMSPTSEIDQERIQVRIRDTGIGVPPNKLEEIFQAFSQVDTSTTRKAGGTGLGLPISRRLVEMHGGRLWADSSGVPGEGSTFYMELPVGGAYES